MTNFNPATPNLPDSNVIDFASFAGTPALPPHNIEAEEAILGGILLDPEAIGRISDRLVPEAFYISAHATIYRAALNLHSLGRPTDLLSLTAWLVDNKFLDKVGGRSKLAQLVTVSALNIDALADLVMDKYTRRRLISAASQIERLAHDGTKSLEQVTDEAEQIVYRIAQSGKPADLNQVESIADVGPRLWEQLEQGKILGTRTNGAFADLDDMTGGLYPGTLTIAAARTSIGKTHLAIALAYEVARQGLPVVFFTCEMSKEQIANRLLARISMIDSDRLRDGRITKQEWEHLANALDVLMALPIHIHSAPRPSATEMRSVLRRTAGQHGGKLGLVVLDYIQLLGDSADNRVNELDKVVRDFRALGKEFDVPCFGLAQINRSVEGRADKRPLLSDIRESGSLEAHADVVLLLYRDDYYNPSSTDRGIIELAVAKNRHGKTGTVRMLFAPAFSLFRNLARGKES